MFVKNIGRYALTFDLGTKKVELDRVRIYTDTGNIATTGINEVSEDDLKALKKDKYFKELVERGEILVLSEKDVKAQSDADESVIKAKDAEIADLKKQVEAETLTNTEALIAKDSEIADLKKKLESLTKDDTATGGF